jgi:uncharacterized membrane protein
MPGDLTALFQSITGQLANWIEIAAAGIIGVATVQALIRAIVLIVRPQRSMMAKESLRLRLGTWLALALEFELAADILRTAIAPTLKEIELLAAIAAIRTGLNYFLQREIAYAREQGAVLEANAVPKPAPGLARQHQPA